MPLLLLIAGLLLPRVVILLLWLFSNWFATAFDTWLVPLLGFLFLPYTLFWYLVVVNWFNAQWGMWQVILLVVALLFDLSSYSIHGDDD